MQNQNDSKLTVVSGLAGIAAAVVGGASAGNAAVVSSTIQWAGSPTDVSDPRPDEPFGLNLDGIAGADYTLTSFYKEDAAPGFEDFIGKYKGDDITGLSSNVISTMSFSQGDTVDATDFAGAGSTATADYPLIKQGSSQYFGLRFGSGPYNYGWLQLREGANADTRWDLVAYGYETTADTAIVIPGVPEPSGLAVLAIGAAALLRRRGQPA